jgi:hypothetical protein
MRRTSKSPAVLLALLAVVFLTVGMSHAARADSPQDCYQQTQQNTQTTAQWRQAAYMNTNTQAPYLDVKMMYCINTIMQMFSQIGMLADPMNIVMGLFNSILNQLMTQLCSSLMNIVNQIKSYLTSLGNSLCLPLPSLPGFGTLNLGLKNPVCNGVSLLSLQNSTGGMSQMTPNYSFYNLGQQGQ